jgi:hypothetical protein
MLMSGTNQRAVLEESPESFWERFSQYAQSWPVCPEPLGSPLLEVLTPWGPLFVFDRTLTPFSGKETPLILHGQVERWEEATGLPTIELQVGGRYLVRGRVGEVPDPQYFVLQLEGSNAGKSLWLLLAHLHPPGPGALVQAYLAPPLMAFRPDAYPR